MLISKWLALTILAMLGIATYYAVFKLLKSKTKLSGKVINVICWIVVVILCSTIAMGGTHSIYILNKDMKIESYCAIGPYSCDMGNGEKADIYPEGKQVTIVNQSDTPMYLETIVYSTSYFGAGQKGNFLPPHSMIRQYALDYYPDESPPSEIRTQGDGEWKYWLRKASETEISDHSRSTGQ